jgi:uncharacterized membrane protein YcaP (DUF421 family)
MPSSPPGRPLKRSAAVFDTSISVLEIAARTAIVYFAIFVGLRLGGKREMGQLTAFDLAVILLIANAVQNAMVGSDVSVTGGLVAAGVLLALNFGVGVARERVPFLRGAVEGHATLLIHEGQFIEENLKREGIDDDMVLMAIREHGVADVKDVQMAVLETDGSISIVPADAKTTRTRKHVRFVRRGA